MAHHPRGQRPPAPPGDGPTGLAWRFVVVVVTVIPARHVWGVTAFAEPRWRAVAMVAMAAMLGGWLFYAPGFRSGLAVPVFTVIVGLGVVRQAGLVVLDFVVVYLLIAWLLGAVALLVRRLVRRWHANRAARAGNPGWTGSGPPAPLPDRQPGAGAVLLAVGAFATLALAAAAVFGDLRPSMPARARARQARRQLRLPPHRGRQRV